MKDKMYYQIKMSISGVLKMNMNYFDYLQEFYCKIN